MEDTQEAGKKSIVKRTFFAITSNGLTKLSVLIDENQTDENQKVVWTKEAQGVAAEQFVVTVTNNKSDKTLSEIKGAASAGKQVVLQRKTGEDTITDEGYLVSISNKYATFCLVNSAKNELDYILVDRFWVQEWVTITDDNNVETYDKPNIPTLMIEKDAAGNYTSTFSPLGLIQGSLTRAALNIILCKDE